MYSAWQLIELDDALRHVRMVDFGVDQRTPDPIWKHSFQTARRRTIALSALETKYLPSIVGRVTLPSGHGWSDFENERRARLPNDLLEMCGIDASELRDMAEDLLIAADQTDPVLPWLSIVRHMKADWWFKLRGPALGAIWRRIAAEILLLADAQLVHDGHLAPMPKVEGGAWRGVFHSRLGGQMLDVEPLEDSLSDAGLTPHPRLLLLVEGPTELVHIPWLVRELFGRGPEFITVQDIGGVTTNLGLLARYAISPRLGSPTEKGHRLAKAPTSLFIAMDPEGPYKTQPGRDEIAAKLRRAIRQDVERQGGEISDDVLDLLVTIEVWGDACYELANFTDDELIDAASDLHALEGRTVDADWRTELRAGLVASRQGTAKLDDVFKRARLGKPALARALLPALEVRLDAEATIGTFTTPVLRIAEAAIKVATKVPRGWVGI